MERYEILKDIGSGNFGVAKLVRDKWSGELHAVKYIERGQKVLFSSSFLSSLWFFLPPLLFLSKCYSLFMILTGCCLVLRIVIWLLCFLSGFCFLGLISPFFFLLLLQIDEHVQREIMNHRSLKHPNIVRFKEVYSWFFFQFWWPFLFFGFLLD